MAWRFPILFLIAAAAALAAERLMLPAPPGYPRVTRNGQTYFQGKLYVARGFSADSLLTPLGVRELQFDQSTSKWGKYKALWPVALHPDSFPPQVLGIDYDQPFESHRTGRYVVCGGKLRPKIRIDCNGFTYIETSYRLAQVFPPAADTTIRGLPYVQGRVYLTDHCDASQFERLGFAPLTRLDQTGYDPTIEDMLENPQWTALMLSEPKRPDGYRTAWPTALDLKEVPECVINLISDWHARGETDKGKPAIFTYTVDY